MATREADDAGTYLTSYTYGDSNAEWLLREMRQMMNLCNNAAVAIGAVGTPIRNCFVSDVRYDRHNKRRFANDHVTME